MLTEKYPIKGQSTLIKYSFDNGETWFTEEEIAKCLKALKGTK